MAGETCLIWTSLPHFEDMPMSVPLQLALRHRDGQGWSEGYHYNPASDQVANNANIQKLAQLRAAMLTSDCKITHARFGTTVKRLVSVVPLNGGLGYTGTLPPPTAPLESAFLFVLADPSKGFNRIFVRGFDRASIDGDSPTFSPAFNSAAGIWENFLFSTPLFNIVGALGSSPTHHKITTLGMTPPRGISFASKDNLGGAGTVITIHNATVPGYNGRKTILSQQSVPPDFLYTAGGAAPAAVDPSTETYATIDTFFDTPVITVQFEKVTRRGVGRPFGLLRGRSATLYALRP